MIQSTSEHKSEGSVCNWLLVPVVLAVVVAEGEVSVKR